MEQRILYIEDNEQNLRLIHKMLSNSPYQLLEATCGADGLAIATHGNIALILMDIHLPDFSGDDLTAHLKADLQTRHIPIIALTADERYANRRFHISLGFDGYLPKPVNKALLLQTIEFFVRV